MILVAFEDGFLGGERDQPHWLKLAPAAMSVG
jgi:hypothetical protein